jgi:hypothetical protein
MRFEFMKSRPQTISSLLIAFAIGMVVASSTLDSDTPVSDHTLVSTRGADGKTYNDGSPVGCEDANTSGDQVTSAGCNASNTFPFTAGTCITCGNPTTQTQATKSTGTGNGVNQTTADCGKKRVGTCQNNEMWPSVMTASVASPAKAAVLYTCNDSGSVGQGNCSAATQTSQQ